jgi:hypothetical protein
MDLSIIIVNYNTKELTGNCIKSVIKNTQNVYYEIILVDNASKDGSCKYLKELFPSVQIITNSDNLGFAKANNAGIRVAKGKFILLLNSDTVFIENCLPQLLAFLNDTPTAGVVGCKVLNADKTLQGSVYHFPSVLSELMFFTKGIIKDFWEPVTYFYKMRYWDHKQIRQVDCVSGCFFMIKKEVLEEIGLLDEEFVMYYEDSEFCLRMRRLSKFVTYYYPFVSIVHFQGKSKIDLNVVTLGHCYKSALVYLRKSYGLFAQNVFDICTKSLLLMEYLLMLPFCFIYKVRGKTRILWQLIWL